MTKRRRNKLATFKLNKGSSDRNMAKYDIGKPVLPWYLHVQMEDLKKMQEELVVNTGQGDTIVIE